MKTFIVVLFLALPCGACSTGCSPYEGLCACDQRAEQPIQTYKPSDEKPSRHPEPAYQRGEVKALTPPSLVSEDETLDREKADATAQGKKAAGVP